MSVIPFHDSPVCRSNNALLCAVFAMVSPNYQGKGVGREQYKLAVNYSIDLGKHLCPDTLATLPNSLKTMITPYSGLTWGKMII